MKAEETQPQLSSQEIFDDLVKQLLAKPEDDEELEIELHGYPADYLDTPKNTRMTLREYKEIERSYGKSIPFIVFTLFGDTIDFGIVFNTKAPVLLFDFGARKAYIATQKLRSLLYDNAENGVVRDTDNAQRFIIKLPTRLLLDNSEVM